MFCQNCGTKNQENSLFCESCGTKLMGGNQESLNSEINTQGSEINTENNETIAKENSPSIQNKASIAQSVTEQQSPQEPKNSYYAGNNNYGNNTSRVRKPLSTKNKIVIIGAIVVVALIGSIYGIGTYLSNPERVAETYFKGNVDKDWEKVYSTLDITEGELINKDAFIKFESEQDSELDGVSKYTVNSSSKDKLATKSIYIDYVPKGSSSTETYPVRLVKQVDKFLLFFDKWKVSSDDIICESYKVGVPKGTTGYVDDYELTEKDLNSEQSDKRQDEYEIKGIFKGKHKVKVTSEVYEDFEKDTTLYNNVDVYASQLELSQDSKDKTETTGKEFLQAYFDTAVAGKDFSEVKKYFDSDSKVQLDMKKKYDSLVTSLKPSADKEIKKFTLSEIEGAAEKGYGSSNNVEVDVTLSYKYEYSGTKKNWLTSALEDFNSGGAKSDRITVTFTREDDKWVINDIGYFYFYF